MSRFDQSFVIPPLDPPIPVDNNIIKPPIPSVTKSISDQHIMMSLNVMSDQIGNLIGKVDKIESTQKSIMKDLSDIRSMMKTLCVMQGSGSGNSLSIHKT